MQSNPSRLGNASGQSPALVIEPAVFRVAMPWRHDSGLEGRSSTRGRLTPARCPAINPTRRVALAPGAGFEKGGHKQSGIGRLRGASRSRGIQEIKTYVHLVPPVGD
jgi:hypothetical protein